MTYLDISRMKSTAKAMLIAGSLAAACLRAGAQPTPAPGTGDLPCEEWVDSMAGDTLSSHGEVDKEGFASLFDGTFKGWFQSCKTAHSQANPHGAVFRIAEIGGLPAIYTDDRDSTIGGVMMTNRKFRNYEIRFQIWPDWGNDGALLHRTPMNGRSYSTTLQYLGAASIGGVWGESGFSARDYRPFMFNGNEWTISTTGSGNGELSNWSAITRKLKATTEPGLPCPETGCTQTEWRALWDTEGWNEIRIQFYGGTSPENLRIHMKSWFKKPSSTAWVPIIQDTTLALIVPDGHIGFKVHGGGRYFGTKGTWYRGIRWAPLREDGSRVSGPVDPWPWPDGLHTPDRINGHFSANAAALVGRLDQDYAITVHDAQGRMLERFSGKAGDVRHEFATETRGILLLDIQAAGGSRSFRVVRP